MKLIHSSDDRTLFLHKIAQPVQFSAFCLRISGDQAAAQSLTKDEIGRVRYYKRGKTIFDVDFRYLAWLTDALGGTYTEINAGAGGLFSMFIVIPRFLVNRQVEKVDPEDNAVFQIQFGAAVLTQADSLLTELYIMPEEGVQEYDLTLQQYTFQYGAAGTFPIDVTTVENIVAAYLSDSSVVAAYDMAGASSLINRVVGSVGPYPIDASKDALIDKTMMKYELQAWITAGTQRHFVELFFADTGADIARLSDSININLQTTGATTPELLLIGAPLNPDKIAQTTTALQQRYRQVSEAKRLSGKYRQVSGLGMIEGKVAGRY